MLGRRVVSVCSLKHTSFAAVFASPSKGWCLGKGTAFESLSPDSPVMVNEVPAVSFVRQAALGESSRDYDRPRGPRGCPLKAKKTSGSLAKQPGALVEVSPRASVDSEDLRTFAPEKLRRVLHCEWP